MDLRDRMEMEYMMTREEQVFFANRLKQLRIFTGATQKRLAQALNISRSCLANYETGRRVPHEEMIQSIAEHFDVRAGYLLGKSSAVLDDVDSNLETFITKDGQLDISDISVEGKIALMEFYHYLNDRSRGNTQKV